MIRNKEIINVKKSNIEADYPVGQKLLINGINCVVTKRGYCPDCILCIPYVPLHDQEVTCANLACTADEREDKTSVHFKEV